MFRGDNVHAPLLVELAYFYDWTRLVPISNLLPLIYQVLDRDGPRLSPFCFPPMWFD